MMTERLYEAYLRTRTVTTDSRQVTPGCLFFALKGERFDGHSFVPQALEQGAALCVVEKGYGERRSDARVVGVDDVQQALQELAREHRRHLAIPVVGITGTNGKTTTKELVHAVLSRRYRTSATRGNLNNHLGVPLTLLSIPADAEVAIVEMGANHPGEIEALCRIADPDCGLITNVGRAHLEGFGSFEGVVSTKTELYRHLAARHGLLFVSADNSRLMREAERLATLPDTPSLIPAYAPGTPIVTPDAIGDTPLSLVTYGSAPDADVHGSHVADSPFMKFYFEVQDNVYTVQTHLLGGYNFDNCMAAVAVGMHFGVEPFAIKEAIEEYRPQNQRSQYRETPRGNRLYLDCYNANPSSMAAAISSFATMINGDRAAATGQRTAAKVQGPHMAIIGGMHELGREERSEHERLVGQLADCGLDAALLVGPEFEGLALPGNMTRLADTEAARRWLEQHPVAGATILIKGSNTNRLWTLEESL